MKSDDKSCLKSFLFYARESLEANNYLPAFSSWHCQQHDIGGMDDWCQIQNFITIDKVLRLCKSDTDGVSVYISNKDQICYYSLMDTKNITC